MPTLGVGKRYACDRGRSPNVVAQGRRCHTPPRSSPCCYIDPMTIVLVSLVVLGVFAAVGALWLWGLSALCAFVGVLLGNSDVRTPD